MFGLKNINSKKWFIQILKESSLSHLASGNRGIIFKCSTKYPLYSKKYGFTQILNEFVLKIIPVYNLEIIKNEVFSMIHASKLPGMPVSPSILHFEVIDNPEINKFLFNKYNLSTYLPHVVDKIDKMSLAFIAMEYLNDFKEYVQIIDRKLPFYRVCNNIFKTIQIQLDVMTNVLHTDFWGRNKGFCNFNKLKDWEFDPEEIPKKNLQQSFIQFMDQFKLPKITEKEANLSLEQFRAHCLNIINSVPIPEAIDFGLLLFSLKKENEIISKIFSKNFKPNINQEINPFNVPDVLYQSVTPLEWSDVLNFFRFYRTVLRKFYSKKMQYEYYPSSQGSPAGLNTSNFNYKNKKELIKLGQIFSIDMLKMDLTYEEKKIIEKINKIMGESIHKTNSYKNISNKLFFKQVPIIKTYNYYENIGEGDVAIMNQWLRIYYWNSGVISQIKYFMKMKKDPEIKLNEFNFDYQENFKTNKFEKKIKNYRLSELQKWLNQS